MFTLLLNSLCHPEPERWFYLDDDGEYVKITVYLWLIPNLPALMLIFIIMIVKPILELYIRWRYDNSYTQILSLVDESPLEDYFVGETVYIYLTKKDNIVKMLRYILILFALSIIAQACELFHVTYWLKIRLIFG